VAGDQGVQAARAELSASGPLGVVVLAVAGVAGGLAGSVAGLASVATYPALLGAGLSPVAANVTNTVALVFSSTGSVSASGPELRGQGARARRLAAVGALGGAGGGVLLLVTPAGAFAAVVPWLVALGSLSMLARRRLVEDAVDAAPAHPGRRVVLGTAVIGVYGGYFGAGAGVMLLALLLHTTAAPLPQVNALKNVVLGLANGVAAVAFALFGPVRWSAVLPLGLGLFFGGRLGPVIVRRVPASRLRVAVALAGLALAVKLGVDAYG
jgi:uncharacterized membrane protein YfcA